MDVLKQIQAERAYKKSVQEMMDEKMCRPGYRWHGEPLNRCLPAAVPSNYQKKGPTTDTPPTPDMPDAPPEQAGPPPDMAIAAEAAKRKQQNKG